ncbi:MAG: hypothetical protein HC901_01355 [Bdellovibrionaceae bacterium]|nr:hypothetical protein [Pseudobdellovibrionaceae bacterium]
MRSLLRPSLFPGRRGSLLAAPDDGPAFAMPGQRHDRKTHRPIPWPRIGNH